MLDGKPHLTSAAAKALFGAPIVATLETASGISESLKTLASLILFLFLTLIEALIKETIAKRQLTRSIQLRKVTDVRRNHAHSQEQVNDRAEPRTGLSGPPKSRG